MRGPFLKAALFLSLSGSAFAADMPVRPYSPVLAPAFSWTGFYLGAFTGIGVQRSHGFDPTGAISGEVDFTGSGFTGGGTVGYNWQFAPNWVLGIEGDIGSFGLSRNFNEYNDVVYFNDKTKWMATLRGRIGYTNGPTLSYVTGGPAWLQVEDQITDKIAGAPTITSERTKAGYALGGGVETMLGGNWTAKAEYLFVNAGGGDLLRTPTYDNRIEVDQHRYHVMRAGVNYLFGGTQPALQPHNWTGFYAGLVGGSAVMSAQASDPRSVFPYMGELGSNGHGLMAGGQIGYNRQFAPAWIVGAEGDLSILRIDHTVDDYDDSPALLNVKTSWIATLRGRLGYSTGPALFYATAGGAWVKATESWNYNAGYGEATKVLSGWTAGGGIETLLAMGWTTRTEYLYVDAGKGDWLQRPVDTPVQLDHKFHLFRIGLAYHFGASAQ